MRRFIFIAIAVLVLAGGGYLMFGDGGASETGYQFSPVSVGSLESTISATGTLSPVTTVEVGTQVSGTIDSVYVDYNDEVVQGQVLAVLDTLLLKTQVLDAEASVERSEAALLQAESDHARNQKLFERQLISEADFLPYQVAVKTQQANLKSAEASLSRAKRNLDYAVITAPIDGLVIERAVEAGQTVAASLSTPTLFNIAQDLAKMEILVDVDESDIGQIKAGQEVRFEVSTYDDKIFSGTVRQVRLQPYTVSNVVTYTVVVNADNSDGWLMPGMTATVDFIIEAKSNILMVANKALRFTPSNDVLEELRARRRAVIAKLPDSLRQARRANAQSPAGPPAGDGMPEDAGMVWLADSDGNLTMEPVRIGMTDGLNTEIVASRSLEAGTQVIVGTGDGTSSSSSSSSARRGMGFGPPPGGPRF